MTRYITTRAILSASTDISDSCRLFQNAFMCEVTTRVPVQEYCKSMCASAIDFVRAFAPTFSRNIEPVPGTSSRVVRTPDEPKWNYIYSSTVFFLDLYEYTGLPVYDDLAEPLDESPLEIPGTRVSGIRCTCCIITRTNYLDTNCGNYRTTGTGIR